jgi:hypothetical protein
MRRWAGLALAITLSGVVAAEAPGATASRSVVGSGATTASGGGRRLLGTAGQAVVGASAAPAHAASHGFWTFWAPQTASVDPPGNALPPPFAIEFGAPTPNPSRGELAFAVGLPHPATVALLVLDVQGRTVSSTATRPLAMGRHRLVFNPAGDAPIAPGIYFARLLVDGHVEAMQRFVRVR